MLNNTLAVTCSFFRITFLIKTKGKDKKLDSSQKKPLKSDVGSYVVLCLSALGHVLNVHWKGNMLSFSDCSAIINYQHFIMYTLPTHYFYSTAEGFTFLRSIFFSRIWIFQHNSLIFRMTYLSRNGILCSRKKSEENLYKTYYNLDKLWQQLIWGW